MILWVVYALILTSLYFIFIVLWYLRMIVKKHADVEDE